MDNTKVVNEKALSPNGAGLANLLAGYGATTKCIHQFTLVKFLLTNDDEFVTVTSGANSTNLLDRAGVLGMDGIVR